MISIVVNDQVDSPLLVAPGDLARALDSTSIDFYGPAPDRARTTVDLDEHRHVAKVTLG